MSDLTSIVGKAMVDRNVMIQLLSFVEPKALDKESTLYDIGYERAKLDMMNILAKTMGSEFATPLSVKMIRELRRANT